MFGLATWRSDNDVAHGQICLSLDAIQLHLLMHVYLADVAAMHVLLHERCFFRDFVCVAMICLIVVVDRCPWCSSLHSGLSCLQVLEMLEHVVLTR